MNFTHNKTTMGLTATALAVAFPTAHRVIVRVHRVAAHVRTAAQVTVAAGSTEP